MSWQLLQRGFGGLVFVFTLFVYLLTSYPSVSFQESGELISGAIHLTNTHAPGSPFYLLLVNVFSKLPLAEELARRINIFSCLISSFTVLLTYLIILRLLRDILSEELLGTAGGKVLIFGGAVVGSLAFAFSDTFWNQAIRAGTSNVTLFFIAAILFLLLQWRSSGENSPGRRLLLAGYLFGLASGVSKLPVLFIVPAVYLVAATLGKERWNRLYSLGIALAAGVLVFPVLTIYLPTIGAVVPGVKSSTISMLLGLCIACLFVPAAAIFLTRRTGNQFYRLAGLLIAMFMLGYSTYMVVPLRSVVSADLRYSQQGTVDEFRKYIHAGTPFLDVPLLDRRWGDGPESAKLYAAYSSDLSFLSAYQIQHQLLRYLFWNFVGRAGDRLHAPPNTAGVLQAEGDMPWSFQADAFPNRYFGIPLLAGIFGLIWQIRNASGNTSIFLTGSFLLFSIGLVFLLNFAEPLKREIDQVFGSAFFVFSLWIGLGTAGIGRYLYRQGQDETSLPITAVIVMLLVVPGGMLYSNWYDHDHGNDVAARDLAYNMLQSCEQGAILITEGDNDTFPLWYLQEGEGIRRDVRVVNSGLLGTLWYSLYAYDQIGQNDISAPERREIIRLFRAHKHRRDSSFLNPDGELRRFHDPDNVLNGFPAEDGIVASGPMAKEGQNISSNESVANPRQDPAGGKFLLRRSWRDVFLGFIIRRSVRKDPLYFSVFCSEESKLGLGDNLRLDGLAWRLIPDFRQDDPGIGEDEVRMSLRHESVNPVREAKRGFIFSPVAGREQYIDRETREYLKSCRSAFMQLASFQLRNGGRIDAIETLDRMRNVLPESVLLTDFRFAYELALLYREAGMVWESRKIFRSVEKACYDEIRKNPNDVVSVYSPYRYLVEMYELEQETSKLLAVLDMLRQHAPDAVDVQTKIDEVRARTQQRR